MPVLVFVRRTGKFRCVSDAKGILNYRLAAVVPRVRWALMVRDRNVMDRFPL